MKTYKVFYQFLFTCFTLILLNGYSYAENGVKHECKILTDSTQSIYCSQKVRSDVLKQNWTLLDTIKSSNPSQPAVIPFDYDGEIINKNNLLMKHILQKKVSNRKKSIINWPKPKKLSRYHEYAINSLDMRGKTDLKICEKYANNMFKKVNSGQNSLTFTAILKFSNYELKNVLIENLTKYEEPSLEDCEFLIGLIMGRV